MRYAPINPELFVANRARLKALLPPKSLVVVNANDIPPTNADGTLRAVPNSDLFHLTGVDQEESILLLFPEAEEPKHRELLFLRETSELIAIWEGHKLTRDEARQRTGIERVHWLSEFPGIFRRLMCESEQVFLNTNEHKRAVIEVESRDLRFIHSLQSQYPLHAYRRLAPLMHQLRVIKSDAEVELIRRACQVTGQGFRRLLRYVKPGATETGVEAELIHEFTLHGGGFAYPPIIASGANGCVLHYVQNDQTCRDGDLLLLDVAAQYAHYNSDLTRTLPVNGRFTRRQKQVYNAVLRVLRASIRGLTPGKRWRQWQQEAETLIEQECRELGLLKPRDLRHQSPDQPAVKKYFMHGLGHPIGLDVHDVGDLAQPFATGWVMTVEPGIYIRDEGLAVRLENTVVIRDGGVEDLMADVPLETDEIEDLMNRRGRRRR